MSVELYLDELQRFADENYHVDLLAARVEYFAGMGSINEDEELFEAHLDRFLDWFLFERVLPHGRQTPLAAYIQAQQDRLPAETLRLYEGFLKNVHSLFGVQKIDKNGVHLRDLADKKKYFVVEEVPNAFTKGQVFEARLLPLGDEWHFSKGYIFHPLSAAKAIEKKVKHLDPRDRDAYRTFIRELALRRLKADRYKHIEPAQFYRF